ncbi:hypothetical protein [Shewanella sp. WPAGA9]|uniref:hypothetical protein n=1 Tax=Shewanella sp. ENK2 TaxID=2775245 RepID=UPI001781A49D|nr:hypothetical protein [Shewanella sp. WPAGA9]
MIIDRENNNLLDSNGQLVKKFDCPLNKQWSHLSTTVSEKVRFCGACQKDVINITSFNEQQIIALFKVNPKACAYVNFHDATCDFKFINAREKPLTCSFENVERLPVINTARDIEAINRAVEEGFTIAIVPNELLDSPTTKKGLFVDENLDLESRGFDYRFPEKSLAPESYKVLGKNLSPFAAYIIPRNFPANTRVYLTDVIEHIVGEYCSSQNNETRVNSCYGFWDGEKITLDEHEAVEYLG